MKLRFRQNTLRLRVNQREVRALASGAALEEQVRFPGGGRMSYRLQASREGSGEASFEDGIIRVAAPQEQVSDWAGGAALGMYFELPADGAPLKVAIEKDLECVDGPEEERDPDAFPRAEDKTC